MSTAADGVAASHTLQPDIVLLDFQLPDGRGTDAVARILAEVGSSADAGQPSDMVAAVVRRA